MHNFIPSPISEFVDKRQWGLRYIVQLGSLALIVVVVCLYCLYSTELSGQPLVHLLNNQPLSWTAGINNISLRSACWSGEVLTARRPSRREGLLFRLPSISLLQAPHIPTTYDFREQHPSCQKLHDAQHQINCSSSWVDTVAAVASDRLCVASKAPHRARLWAPEMAACCTLCQGPLHAWLYLNVRGFPEVRQGSSAEEILDSCGVASRLKWVGGQHTNHTPQNRYYGTSAFLLAQSVVSVQVEMMRNGPVVAILDVYSDFYYYSSGVYQYRYGSYQGSMAVKLMGWGQEAGLDYWLAGTSLGLHWGDRGIFKIRRGTNECRMEEDITAGHLLPP